MTAPGNQAGAQLGSSEIALSAAYDAALLDLDGVVYVGSEPILHAASVLRDAAARGLRLTYVTNNASRTPAQVVEILRSVGVDADADEIATSAKAAARLLAEHLPTGAKVLVVGAEGLRTAVENQGLTVVATAAENPAAVVQGFSESMSYAMLAEAVLAVNAGAFWVATNLDATIPTPRGMLPGNGALVAAVRHATGATPVAAGKPQRPLHDEAVRRTGATRPLVVGDRLDTDIDGALAVGADSLLVLTGVTTLLDLARVPAGRRPTYVSADLRALLVAHLPIKDDDGVMRCGPAAASFADGVVTVSQGSPAPDDDMTSAIRVACACAWRALDAGEAIRELAGVPPS